MLIGENVSLKEYLILNRMSIENFSRLIDFSRNHTSQVINGRKAVTYKMARAIERVTKGQVIMENIVEKKDCAQSL
jgi:DNA-binding transcriptional regulator YdaS (Cro superfamily)